mgnify:CR=1 FL=1
MKENGKMIKLMDMENIIIKMEPNIKVNGKKINNKDLVKNHGQMVLIIRGIMRMEKNMEKDYFNLLRDHFMMESSIIMIFMERVNML